MKLKSISNTQLKDGRSGQAKGGHVRSDVQKMFDLRRLGHPHFADDQRPQVQGRARIAPGIVRQSGQTSAEEVLLCWDFVRSRDTNKALSAEQY
jgi:hypothetical protein